MINELYSTVCMQSRVQNHSYNTAKHTSRAVCKTNAIHWSCGQPLHKMTCAQNKLLDIKGAFAPPRSTVDRERSAELTKKRNMADELPSNPFWQRKMKTLFALSYKNSSGKIGKAQTEESVKHISSVTNSKQSEKLKANVDELMSELEMPEDGIDYDTFVRNALTLIKANKIGVAVESIFGTMDYDSDGVVSPSEYEKFLRCFNADTSKAKESFSYIDTNKNGKLSKTEFHSAVVKFYTCLDEDDPSKFVFGPLVE